MPPKRHSTESGEETKTKKARSSEPKKKWSKEDKTEILLEVIATAQPDWDQLAERFGVTKSKVKDQWRQHILPHLKKTGSVSGDAHDVKSD